MNDPLPFAQILEAVDQLSPEDQEILVEIVRRRVAVGFGSGWPPRSRRLNASLSREPVGRRRSAI